MPFLNPSYFANYYYLSLFGNSYIVSKFDRADDFTLNKKLFLQGDPGIKVADASYKLYRFTISGPLFIPSNVNGSLLKLAADLINAQYATMKNSTAYNSFLYLESMNFNVGTDSLEVTMNIVSYDPEIGVLQPVLNTNSTFFPDSRLAKYYDTILNFSGNNFTGNYLLSGANIGVKFEVDIKTFFNYNANVPFFILKTYEVTTDFTFTINSSTDTVIEFQNGQMSSFVGQISVIVGQGSGNKDGIIFNPTNYLTKSYKEDFGKEQVITAKTVLFLYGSTDPTQLITTVS